MSLYVVSVDANNQGIRHYPVEAGSLNGAIMLLSPYLSFGKFTRVTMERYDSPLSKGQREVFSDYTERWFNEFDGNCTYAGYRDLVHLYEETLNSINKD